MVKSKVNWNLAQEYFHVEDPDAPQDIAADDEVSEKLKRKALMNKHMAGLENNRVEYLSCMPDHNDYEVKVEIFNL